MMLARCTATVFTLSSSFAAISRFDMAVANQLQHFELPRRQTVRALAFERRRPVRPRIEDRFSRRDPLHRRGQIEIQRVLQDVAARAGVQRLPHERFLRVHAEHQHGDVGMSARICFVAARPFVPGIATVHHDDVPA